MLKRLEIRRTKRETVPLSLAFFKQCFPNDEHHGCCYLYELSLKVPQQGRVLDLGCGTNVTLAGLRTASCEVWGADFYRHPRLEHQGWFRQLAPDGRVPFDDSTFDIVAASWVLEHVTRPGAFLAEVKRILRPGGLFIAHTINARHYVALLNRLLGMFSHGLSQRLVSLLYRRPDFDTHRAYYRLNTPESLARHSRQAGLSFQGIRTYADPFYFHFSPTLMNAAIGLDWLLERWLPGTGRIYLTATMKKPAADFVQAETRAA